MDSFIRFIWQSYIYRRWLCVSNKNLCDRYCDLFYSLCRVCGVRWFKHPPEDTTPVPTATYEPDPQPSETVANTIDVETVGLNEILTIQNPQVNAEISVDEVIRGSRANTIVAESSPESDMFSSEPVHGYEYLMVHIRIKNTDDYSLAVSPYFDLPVYASGAVMIRNLSTSKGIRFWNLRLSFRMKR